MFFSGLNSKPVCGLITIRNYYASNYYFYFFNVLVQDLTNVYAISIDRCKSQFVFQLLYAYMHKNLLFFVFLSDKIELFGASK